MFPGPSSPVKIQHSPSIANERPERFQSTPQPPARAAQQSEIPNGRRCKKLKQLLFSKQSGSHFVIPSIAITLKEWTHWHLLQWW